MQMASRKKRKKKKGWPGFTSNTYAHTCSAGQNRSSKQKSIDQQMSVLALNCKTIEWKQKNRVCKSELAQQLLPFFSSSLSSLENVRVLPEVPVNSRSQNQDHFVLVILLKWMSALVAQMRCSFGPLHFSPPDSFGHHRISSAPSAAAASDPIQTF